jgi:hypothetical protein
VFRLIVPVFRHITHSLVLMLVILASDEYGSAGAGGMRIRLLYDRHIEQENNDSMDETIPSSSTVKSHLTDKYVIQFKVSILSK